jgi:ABC-type Fe3+ transport system substrate-binding protein
MTYELDVLDPLHLLALLPCPLKVPIENAFHQMLERAPIKMEEPLKFLVEGNANNQLSYYQHVDCMERIEEIPDIVISPGLNSFYHKRFVERFMDKGYFYDATKALQNQNLNKLNIQDPNGVYTIFSMNILVMVVDKRKLGDLKMPCSFSDILAPQFEKKVAIRGQKTFYCETTLLSIYKLYGMEGVLRLVQSVKYGWHPSQMAKLMGSGQEDTPVVSVMPYFFAKTLKYKEHVEVVWPTDGAIVSPVTMLVKKERAEALAPIVDFFASEEVGRICAGADFPSMHQQVENTLPKDAKFHWLGWDFLREHDIGVLVEKLTRVFFE